MKRRVERIDEHYGIEHRQRLVRLAFCFEEPRQLGASGIVAFVSGHEGLQGGNGAVSVPARLFDFGDGEVGTLVSRGFGPDLGGAFKVLQSFVVTVLAAIMVSTISSYVAPESLRLLRRWVAEVRADLVSNIVQPGRFTAIEQGLPTTVRDLVERQFTELSSGHEQLGEFALV